MALRDALFGVTSTANKKRAEQVVQHQRSQGFYGSSVSTHQRTIATLEALYKRPLSLEELKEYITDCNADGGIDAFVFSEHSVDIFDCKVSDNLGKKEAIQLESVYNQFFASGKPDKVDDDWLAIQKKVERFHSLKGRKPKLNIYIVRPSFRRPLNADIQAVLTRLNRKAGVSVELISEDVLVERMLDIDLIPLWELPKVQSSHLYPNPDRRTYNELILLVPLTNILSLFQEHSKKSKDLFVKNIRIPRPSLKFSKGLEESLSNIYKEKFFLYHNGLTIVAGEISADSANYIITKPQVVNGAQTVANLAKVVSKKGKGILREAKILCKIIKADEKETTRICETSNTQKAVKVEDLRTNDIFQVELQSFIYAVSEGKYYYSRKGERSTIKGARKIKYTTFFQWAYASFLFKPARAKTSKTSLFDLGSRGEYKKIVTEIEKNQKKILTLCHVGVFVEDTIRKMPASSIKFKVRKGLARDMSLHLVAGLYALALKSGTLDQKMLEKKFEKIFKLLKARFLLERKQNITLDSGQFFTKFDTGWKFLESKLSSL